MPLTPLAIITAGSEMDEGSVDWLLSHPWSRMVETIAVQKSGARDRMGQVLKRVAYRFNCISGNAT